MNFDKCSIWVNDIQCQSMNFAEWSTSTFSIVCDGSPLYWPETLERNRFCGGLDAKFHIVQRHQVNLLMVEDIRQSGEIASRLLEKRNI